jgi:hypothetical protein
MRRKFTVIGIAALLCWLCLPPHTALAQAGSAGGTLGKHNKSASGGDSAAPEAPARPKKRKAVATRSNDSGEAAPARKGSGCGHVAGTWTANGWWNGLYGRGDVTLNADGSARHVSGIIGTWTCDASSHFVMDWKNWAHAEGTMAGDGNSITFPDGGTMTRGR